MTTLLNVENLGAHVGRRRLLEDISFELRAFELTALLGANGAGKSTLLRVLMGGLAASEGKIVLLGERLQGHAPADRARSITLVPQHQASDFPLRVHELAELGRLPHVGRDSAASNQAAVHSALQRTALLALAQREVSTLSGGELQRASLARALAQCAPVLLLDEPTAHLDIAHQLTMLEVVRDLTRSGGAALVALHDLAMAARFADRVLVLHGGRLVASGPPSHVLSAELLHRCFGVETEIERDHSGAIRHLTVLGAARGARPC